MTRIANECPKLLMNENNSQRMNRGHEISNELHRNNKNF